MKILIDLKQTYPVERSLHLSPAVLEQQDMEPMVFFGQLPTQPFPDLIRSLQKTIIGERVDDFYKIFVSTRKFPMRISVDLK